MRCCWPRTTLSQVGEFESSKSAMKTRAPELSALMTIFRSTGPVISTRRSWRSAGRGATVQLDSRTARVSGRKCGRSPASKRRWRSRRRSRSSSRRPAKSRTREPTKSRASGVRMASWSGPSGPRTRSPLTARDVTLIASAPSCGVPGLEARRPFMDSPEGGRSQWTEGTIGVRGYQARAARPRHGAQRGVRIGPGTSSVGRPGANGLSPAGDGRARGRRQREEGRRELDRVRPHHAQAEVAGHRTRVHVRGRGNPTTIDSSTAPRIGCRAMRPRG